MLQTVGRSSSHAVRNRGKQPTSQSPHQAASNLSLRQMTDTPKHTSEKPGLCEHALLDTRSSTAFVPVCKRTLAATTVLADHAPRVTKTPGTLCVLCSSVHCPAAASKARGQPCCSQPSLHTGLSGKRSAQISRHCNAANRMCWCPNAWVAPLSAAGHCQGQTALSCVAKCQLCCMSHPLHPSACRLIHPCT